MKYCSKCGVQIDDHAAFCPICGHGQKNVQVKQADGAHRLHCPVCKSNQLSPVVETEISGGSSLNRSVTRKSSVSAFSLKSTHRDYWMCHNCGHKFRNIENLNEEIAMQKKAQSSCIYSAIFFAILSIIAFGSAGIVAAVLLGMFFLGFWVYFKKKIDVLKQEHDQLVHNCFQ